MKHVWLKQSEGASRVLVVFGGWAIGAEVFSSLQSHDDILFISEYRDLDYALPDLSHYHHRILVAWSFGIASYCHWQAKNKDVFERKIAINGSMIPIDREKGIPPQAMQKTIDTLSNASFQIFLTRAHNAKVAEIKIDVGAREAELIAVLERGAAPAQQWDRIWLSQKDRIFPPANMERAWAQQAHAVKRIDEPHVPFHHWQNWDEVIDA